MHGRAMYGPYKATEEGKYVFGASDRFDEQVEKRASIRSNRYLYIRNYMPQQSVYRPVKFRLDMPMMQEMLQLNEAGKLDTVQKRWFLSPAFEEELYDCMADPHQIYNLCHNIGYQKVLEQMRTAYRKEWIEPFNTDWEQKAEEYFVNKMWPEGVKPCCERPRLRTEKGKVHVENDLDIYSAIYRMKDKEDGWHLYTNPVSLKEGECIILKLERIGYKDSEPIEYLYQVK